MSWERVNRQEPCVICGKSDWCMVADDGSSALCMRVQSQKELPLKSGEVGYIHILREREKGRDYKPVYRPKPVKQYIDAEALYNSKVYIHSTKTGLSGLAHDLGVTQASLESSTGVGAVWFNEHDAWGFPMRDGNYKVVGIRLRNKAGEKWAVKGSKSGVFYSLVEPEETLYICEGPTDTAAALSCHLFAIGRPSCSSGGPEILEFIRRNKAIREVVIISDNDGPGQRGAEALQKQLPCRSALVTLPCKDMRQFYKDGGCRHSMDYIVSGAVWHQPRCR
jgi:hypothetical protein